MNGAGKGETIDCAHGVEDQAVSALTRLMTLYLDKNASEKPRTAKGSGDSVRDRETDAIVAAKKLRANTLALLEHPEPGALKDGMRAIGTALSRKPGAPKP